MDKFDILIKDKAGKIINNIGEVSAFYSELIKEQTIDFDIGLISRQFLFLGVAIMDGVAGSGIGGYVKVKITGNTVTLSSIRKDTQIYRGVF